MKEKPKNSVKEQEKVKPSKARNGKETGDSILKGKKGRLMSRQKNVQCKHAPTLPYMTKDLKNMIRQRDYLNSKAVKTGSKYLF